MATTDATTRLFVDQPLAPGATVACTPAQANSLANVLRLRAGARLLVFDGETGEWSAEIAHAERGRCVLKVGERVRAQAAGPDVHYLFAPLKRARLDYMVQKATELGVSALCPVLTRRTVPARVNLQRVRANVIEAAEQCGILRLPLISAPERLERVLDGWSAERRLIYCDEAATVASPLEALAACPPGPLAVLCGPEGGFDAAERAALRRLPFVVAISLGPRVMRADTAAVAALTLVNAVLGDWR